MVDFFPSQDRLIRREVSLGFLNERTWPENHVILEQFAPLYDVDSDDFVFEYVPEPTTYLAPARAEDAEAEMASKTDTYGTGRGRMQDWAVKDHYKPSDISRYRELNEVVATLVKAGYSPLDFPTTVGNDLRTSFDKKVARDSARRQQALYNRIEWLGHQALWTNHIAYNDGNIVYDVAYNRPDAQGSASASVLWDDEASDPIQDILDLQIEAFDLYGIELKRGLISNRILRKAWTSNKFAAIRTGLAVAGGPASGVIDPKYTGNWSPKAALDMITQATGVEFSVFDGVYRTGDPGSAVNHRFSPDDKMLLLPAQEDIAAIDQTEIGFGKTCSAPHVANGWQSGWYTWEKDHGQDPWSYDFGTGIKAWPIFPHLDWTWVVKVIENGTAQQAKF